MRQIDLESWKSKPTNKSAGRVECREQPDTAARGGKRPVTGAVVDRDNKATVLSNNRRRTDSRGRNQLAKRWLFDCRHGMGGCGHGTGVLEMPEMYVQTTLIARRFCVTREIFASGDSLFPLGGVEGANARYEVRCEPENLSLAQYTLHTNAYP